MRITKRSLRRIIREEHHREFPIEFYTDEQLMSEGLLDFLGGLFGKMMGFFKDLSGEVSDTSSSVASSLSSSVDSSIAAAAADDGRDDITSADDLDMEDKGDQKLFFKALVPWSTEAAQKALEFLATTDSVEEWVPESDSDEDIKIWEEQHADGTVGIWEAWGVALGSLKFFGNHGISAAESEYERGAAITEAMPAEAIRACIDSVNANIDVWDTAEAIEGDDGVTAAWGKVVAKATSIGEKVAAAGKEEQKEEGVKEWVNLRRWINSKVISERRQGTKMKVTKRQLRIIIKEEVSRLSTEGFLGGLDPAEALPHLEKALSILAGNTDNKEAMDAVITAIEALEHPEFAE